MNDDKKKELIDLVLTVHTKCQMVEECNDESKLNAELNEDFLKLNEEFTSLGHDINIDFGFLVWFGSASADEVREAILELLK